MGAFFNTAGKDVARFRMVRPQPRVRLQPHPCRPDACHRAIWIALSSGGLDREGKPIGADFAGFWTASRLALNGRPDLAYDIGAHWAAQKALFGPRLGYTAFFYPPPALLVYLPLALAPYFWSLAAWLMATGYAFFRVVRGFLPGLDPVALLAFPAVFINAAHGQNGFLSAALIGGGLLVMDRRPALAGLLFGAMAFKPHLALVLPFALLFARRWTTLATAAIAAAGFCLLSLIAFGAPAWSGILRQFRVRPLRAGEQSRRQREDAERLRRRPVAAWFAAARLGIAGLRRALGAIAALFYLQRRAFRGPGEAAATVCAGLLATPFLLDYDLTLMAIPLAWLLRRRASRRIFAVREGDHGFRLSAAADFAHRRGRARPAPGAADDPGAFRLDDEARAEAGRGRRAERLRCGIDARPPLARLRTVIGRYSASPFDSEFGG